MGGWSGASSSQWGPGPAGGPGAGEDDEKDNDDNDDDDDDDDYRKQWRLRRLGSTPLCP